MKIINIKSSNLNQYIKIIGKISGLLGIFTFIIIILYIIFIDKDLNFSNWNFSIDLKKASNLGGFIVGTSGVLISIAVFSFIYLSFEKQKEQFKKNSFDNSFFNLYNEHRQLILSIENKKIEDEIVLDSTLSDLTKSLKDIFSIGGTDLPKELETYKINYYPTQIRKVFQKNHLPYFKKEINKKYNYIYDDIHSQLGGYFRFMFNFLNFIDSADINKKEKHKYIELVQAQTSDAELGLLFFFGLNQRGEKLKPLLDKYCFLQDINMNKLIYPEVLAKFYAKTNFKFQKEIDEICKNENSIKII